MLAASEQVRVAQPSVDSGSLDTANGATTSSNPLMALCAAVPNSGENDMMVRFEALSNLFKNEVESMFGKEKECAQEDLARVRDRLQAMETMFEHEDAEVSAVVATIRSFVAERWTADHVARVFGTLENERLALVAEDQLPASRLRPIIRAFLQTCVEGVRPELEKAEREIESLRSRNESSSSEIVRLREELQEARKLKTQEEKELIEFKTLREKDSELQNMRIELQQYCTQLEESKAKSKQTDHQTVQQQVLLKEKGDKIIELVRQLERHGERLRHLSDENNALRLELGRDADYAKVFQFPIDPLIEMPGTGKLPEGFLSEETRLKDALHAHMSRFYGVAGGNSEMWCRAQISRMGSIYRSFLYKLQDYQASFPQEIQVEFASKAQEVDGGWREQEQVMREAGADFQDQEQKHNQEWEEKRLVLIAERDAKVKQLCEQAGRSQSQAEQQLLLHQAKLFGQRIDAQVERAWEEQRKERDARWHAHQQRKQEARKKLKDESLSVQQKAEDRASVTGRFEDLAGSRLASVEDTWQRESDREATVSASALRSGDIAVIMRAAKGNLQDNENAEAAFEYCHNLPSRGAQHTGIGVLVDSLAEMLKSRQDARQQLRIQLEEHSLQQLRGCIEKFIAKEAASQKKWKSAEDETAPQYNQASAILSLIRMRQHRHIKDALQRHFYDYLIVLRICVLGALWLLPPGAAEALNGGNRAFVQDLPEPPKDILITGEASPIQKNENKVNEENVEDDRAVEGNFLYNDICSRLLDRALTMLNSQQRDELLSTKRAHAAEQRIVLDHFCQTETDLLNKVVENDLKEYETQMATRLLCEQEYLVAEERKRLVQQVNEEVGLHVVQYRRQIEQQEQKIVQERRKWLTERLIVLQANGGTSASDRALFQRFRHELRACESKIELFDNEFVKKTVPTSASDAGACKHFPTDVLLLPSTTASKSEGRPFVPAVPSSPGQAHPSQPSATGQAPQVDNDLASDPKRQHIPERRTTQLPTFGSIGGIDGDTVPLWPCTPETPDIGTKQALPLCEWPFDSGSVIQPPKSPNFIFPTPPNCSQNLSVPTSPRLRPLECLAPIKGNFPDFVEKNADAPRLSLKSATRNRRMPPLLPPVQTPR